MTKRFPLPEALAAVGGGIVWALCFGREPSLWLGWVALVPLAWLLGRPRRVLWGLVHGTTTWLVSAYWIPPTLVTFGELPRGLAWFVLLLMSLYLGFFHALFAWLGRPLWRRGGAVALFALPALWVAIEWLRSVPVGFHGFPWNLAAYAWIEVPGALPLAAWVGAYGVGYLLLLANVALTMAAAGRRWQPAAIGLLGAALPLIVAAGWSRGVEDSARPWREVRIVQPNPSSMTPADPAVIWDGYRRLVATSQAACGGGPALLVWPESAAWPFDWIHAPHLRRDLRGLAAQGCEVVFSSPTVVAADSPSEEVDYHNSALLIAPDGPAGTYHKRLLVPWGEYVPLATLLPFVGKLARHAGDFTPGREVALLPWGEERLGMAICYEVIFPEAVAAQVRSGATLLVTISNDAWYGDTSAPRQLFRAARFRAAENRRPHLRAALTGISGLIGRRGEVEARLGVGAEGVLRVRVQGATDLSPYTRVPWLVPLASALGAVFAIVHCVAHRRRKHHVAAESR